jgi:integrase/recombinase XerC
MATNGRLEKEEKIKEKIQEKLKDLNPILTEFSNDMIGDQKSYNTINSYINYVIEFINFISKDETDKEFYKHIKTPDIKSYISSISTRQVNGQTVRVSDDLQATKWSALNTFFIFLINNDYIQTNPMVKTKRPKIRTEHKVTYLTQDEINQMFDNIKREAHSKLLNRDLALFSLFLSTGLRNSALTQINIEDIDFSNNTIKIIEKGNKTRTIQFGLNMRQLLLSWLKDRELFFSDVTTNALFISQLKERISIHTVGQLVKKYTKNIKGKHITPHKLRATACTMMSTNGIPIQVIKDMVGHENIQTTTRYVGVLEEERKQATNVLDNSIMGGA